MASTLRTALALAALAVGGSALSLSPLGAQDVCGPKFLSFEHLDEDFPLACIVYCVPEGACVEKARDGPVRDKLHLAGEGNCKQRGYNQSMELGPTTEKLTEGLKDAEGVCRGMKLLRFRRPGEGAVAPAVAPAVPPAVAPAEAGPATPPAAPRRKFCGGDHFAYRAITYDHAPGRLGRSVCTVYCVPLGECQGMAQAGKLGHLNISAEGTCQGTEYTEPAEPTPAMSQYIKTRAGACRGMTMRSFRVPMPPRDEPSVTSDGRVCGLDAMAYESHNPLYPDACGVYCVPKGQCEGLVQSGKLNLGITQQGNCRGRGFTELANTSSYGAASEAAYNAARSFKGPCKGMTYAKFAKPQAV